MRQWDPIIVQWEDAWDTPDDHLSSAYLSHRPVIRNSIGFLLQADDDRVVIAGTDDRMSKDHAEGDVANVLVVPRGMVRSITKLRALRR